MVGKNRMCYNGSMHKRVSCEGFTMVELSLSLVFISILSIAVVLVISSAVSSYHRGITLSKIDSVGSSLMRDMSFAIKLSSARSLKSECDNRYSHDVESETEAKKVKSQCEEDFGRNFVSVARYADVTVGDSELEGVPVFGAFCTGSYSYIWNSGYLFSDEYVVDGVTSKASFKYDKNVNPIEGFRLLKVKDESRLVCEAAVRVRDGVKLTQYEIRTPSNIGPNISNINGGETVFDVSVFDDFEMEEEPIELLGGDEDGGNNLALYGLSADLSEQVEIDKNAYYYTSFVLGTIQGGVNVNAKGNYCATPDGYNKAVEQLDYCAINKFNFAALATGG